MKLNEMKKLLNEAPDQYENIDVVIKTKEGNYRIDYVVAEDETVYSHENRRFVPNGLKIIALYMGDKK